MKNVKALLTSVKSVCLRNFNWRTPYSDALQLRGSSLRGLGETAQEFGPLLLPRLYLVLQAVDPAGSCIELHTSEAAPPSLNPTWPIQETLWVDAPCALTECTALQVHIASADTGQILLSLLLHLRGLQPLHCSLHSMPPLPLNSLVLELTSGELYAARELACAVGAKEQLQDSVNTASTSSSSDDDSHSYDAEELEALTQLRTEVLALEARAAELRTSVEQSFAAAAPERQQALAAAERSAKVSALRQQVRAEAACLAREAACAARERAALEAETQQLQALAAAAAQHSATAVPAAQTLLLGEQSSLRAAAALVQARELRLAAGLRAVYPIRYSAQAGAYTIWDVPVDLLSRDDELVSAALGHAAHLTCLLAKYLGVSLRYQIIYSASRSSVRDAAIGSGAAYPLFKKGVDQDRFARAVTLLSRNVEQLLSAKGVALPQSSGGAGEAGEGGGILIRLQYIMAQCAAQADAAVTQSAADTSTSSKQQLRSLQQDAAAAASDGNA